MDADRLLTVGELADLAGLTVRTLHHWDAIGLLVPSERSAAGHRRYGAADRERLVRVLGLRRLGLSLRDVAAALQGADLGAVLSRQAEQVRGQLAAQRELLDRLEGVLRAVERGGTASDTDVIDLIGAMRMEQHFTQEQLATLAERREALGEAGLREVDQAWPQVIAEAQAAKAEGADPGSERVQAIAARYAELLSGFTGGDPAMLAALERVNAERGETYDMTSPIGAEIRAAILRAHGQVPDRRATG
jgi:DNA-binding transcriptional MerR regulator